MSKRHRSRTSALGLVVAGALLIVVAAACGGSSAKAASTTSTTAGNRAAGFAAYRTCLSQHGITLPQRTPGSGGPPSTTAGGTGGGGSGAGAGGFGGGGFGGGGFGGTPRSLPPGVTTAQYAAAQKACASKLPAGGFGGFGGRGGQAFQAYASCLRDHGVTIPSIPRGTSSTTAAGSPRPTFNRNDPKFIAANKVCQALLPSRTTTTTAG
jgi:hypothetical protein